MTVQSARFATAWLGTMHGPDHLYPTCPALLRVKPWHDSGEWPVQCNGLVDPEDADLCGWCRRIWRARQRVGEQ